MAFTVGDIQGRLLLDADPYQAGLAQARADAAAFEAEHPTATFNANTGTINAQVADVMAKLNAVGAKTATAAIGLDTGTVYPTLGEAQTALADFAKQLSSAQLGATAKPFWADIGALRAELGALSPFDVSVGATVGAAMAQIAAMQGAMGDIQTGTLLTSATAAAAGGGTKGSSGGLLGLLGGLLGGGAAGGGGAGGLLAALGWGGGGGIGPWLGGMASFGSLLSMMGFGAEHVAATGVGVAGSLAGAGLGAGFLGLGAMGTMGVGMGTDMAGIGQALGDMKTTLTAITKAVPVTNAILAAQVAYNKALITGGTNSLQFATATKGMQSALASYNTTVAAAIATNKTLQAVLRGFSPVAQQAVVAAAEQANALHMLFNAATGTAERIGANILNQAMVVGEKFLPTIGIYATQNMGIIQSSLQPFFKWLDTSTKGGLKIFTNLEKVFQSHLPTAMHAFEQGFELLAKTITISSGFLGTFLTMINKFLTRMNGATFGKWSKFVTDMISSFNDWFGLLTGGTNRAMSGLGGLIGFVIDLFKPAVGLGDQIAIMLTGIFNQIDGWLSASHTLLHGLFTAHAKELITGIGAIITAALPIVEAFASAFVQFATGGGLVATGILRTIADLLGEIDKIPFASDIIGWGAALAFFAPKVLTGLAALATNIALLPATFANMVANAGEAFSTLSGYILRAYVNITNLGMAIGTFVAESIISFGTLVASMFGVEAATVGMQLAFAALGTVGILGLAVGIYELIKNFGVLPGLMIAGAAAVVGLTVAFIALDTVPIVALIAGIGLAIIGLIAGIVYLVKHWDTVWNGLKTGLEAVVTWFKGLPADFETYGRDIIDGLLHGVTSAAQGVVRAVEGVGHDIINGIKDVLGISSPSRVMTQAGQTTMAGLTNGITKGSKLSIAAATKAAQEIIKAFGSLTKLKAGDTSLHAVTKLLKTLTEALTALSKFGSKTVNFTSLVANFNAMTAALKTLTPTLKTLEGIIKTLGGAALKTTASGFAHLSSVFKSLDTVFTAVTNVVKAAATATFPAFDAAVMKLADDLPTLTPALWALQNAFSELTTSGLKQTTKGLATLATTFEHFTAVLTAIAKVVATSAGIDIPADMAKLGTVSAQLAAGLTTEFDNLDTITKLHWASISKAIKTAEADITSPLQKIASTAKTVKTKLATAWTSIDTTLKTKWTTIVAYLGGLPAKMEAPFAGIATKFIGVGQQLMAGLTEGIQAGTAPAVAAMTTAVQQLITIAKKVPHIKSPSAVMANTVGIPLMQGIAVGIATGTATAVGAITSSLHQVVSAAQTIATSVRLAWPGMPGTSVPTAYPGAATGTAVSTLAWPGMPGTSVPTAYPGTSGTGTTTTTTGTALQASLANATAAMAVLTKVFSSMGTKLSPTLHTQVQTVITSLTANLSRLGKTVGVDLATSLAHDLAAFSKGTSPGAVTALTGILARIQTAVAKLPATAKTPAKATATTAAAATALKTLATTTINGLTKAFAALLAEVTTLDTLFKTLATQLSPTIVNAENFTSNLDNASAALAQLATNEGAVSHQITVGAPNFVFHGADLSNPAAISAVIKGALDDFTETLTALLEQQG